MNSSKKVWHISLFLKSILGHSDYFFFVTKASLIHFYCSLNKKELKLNNGHIICIYSTLLLTVQNSQLNVSTLQFSIICDKVNMHKLTVLLALTFFKEGLPQCLVMWSRSNRSLISVNQVRVLATGYVKLLFCTRFADCLGLLCLLIQNRISLRVLQFSWLDLIYLCLYKFLFFRFCKQAFYIHRCLCYFFNTILKLEK